MSRLQRRLELARPLLPPREWARVEAYVLDDAGFGTDSFGTDSNMLGFGYALGYWLHKHYFRVVSSGHDHLPKRGAAVVAGNHSGVLPFDAVMIATDVFRYTDPPRLMRYMVDYFVYRVPFLGVFFRSMGQMPGTRAELRRAHRKRGTSIGIFPEGAEASGEDRRQRRYELYPFNPGHVELAARHGVPVVPFGLVGAEEQIRHGCSNFEPLAHESLRLPYFPITHHVPVAGSGRAAAQACALFHHITASRSTSIPRCSPASRLREREVARVRDAVARAARRRTARRGSKLRGRCRHMSEEGKVKATPGRRRSDVTRCAVRHSSRPGGRGSRTRCTLRDWSSSRAWSPGAHRLVAVQLIENLLVGSQCRCRAWRSRSGACPPVAARRRPRAVPLRTRRPISRAGAAKSTTCSCSTDFRDKPLDTVVHLAFNGAPASGYTQRNHEFNVNSARSTCSRRRSDTCVGQVHLLVERCRL